MNKMPCYEKLQRNVEVQIIILEKNISEAKKKKAEKL